MAKPNVAPRGTGLGEALPPHTPPRCGVLPSAQSSRKNETLNNTKKKKSSYQASVARRWVGWPCIPGKHDRRPGKGLYRQQAASDVVHVVAVAIICTVERDHCRKPRRLSGRNLKAIEASPRLAVHGNMSRRPRLRYDPGNHFIGIH